MKNNESLFDFIYKLIAAIITQIIDFFTEKISELIKFCIEKIKKNNKDKNE